MNDKEYDIHTLTHAHTLTMEYYSASNKEEILQYGTTRMNL